MSVTLAIILFCVIFAVVLVAISMGLRYVESSRKKQVFKMLETVAGQAPPAPNLMKDKPKDLSLFEKLLSRFDLIKKTKATLVQADLAWRPETLFMVMMGTGAVGALAGTRIPIGNPLWGALAAGVILTFVPWLYVSHKKSKRIAAMDKQLPDALEFLARSMRAGHALTMSLSMVGEELPDPLGREFRTMFNEQRLGGRLETALSNLCERVPLQDLKFFASALLLQRQTGGNLSEILRQLSTVIRERFRLKGQVQALSAHGRMTSMVLTGLPIVTTFLLNLVAPDYLSSLLKDSDGQKMIIGAIVLQVLGVITIQKIIKIEV